MRTPRLPRLAAVICLTLVAFPLLLTACGDDNSSASDNDKIQVVTTLPLFADFVRNVGGDRVDVTSLLPLGADPHTFEPSPRDVEKITDADIAFANGLGLEPSLTKVLEANLPDDAGLVKLGEIYAYGYPQSSGTNPAFDRWFGGDPHLWLNPVITLEYVETLASQLASVDMSAGGESAHYFEDRQNEYAELVMKEFEHYRTENLPKIPVINRRLVTAHNAFRHFAQAYHLQATAAVAESPGQEPSPNEIADLTAAIKDQNIPAVFSEPQISEESHILEQAAADAGVQVCTLYSDSLDEEVSTYIEMMRFNADELARCLGGDSGN